MPNATAETDGCYAPLSRGARFAVAPASESHGGEGSLGQRVRQGGPALGRADRGQQQHRGGMRGIDLSAYREHRRRPGAAAVSAAWIRCRVPSTRATRHARRLGRRHVAMRIVGPGARTSAAP